MKSLTFIVLWACLCLPGISQENDWLEIAEKTKTPAIGSVIKEVEAGGVGEELGLKQGEVISALDGIYFGFGRKIPNKDFQIEVYSPETDKTRVVDVPQGSLNVKRAVYSHPWVSYLRGELGTRGEWDHELVTFMVSLFQVGEVKEGEWNAILDKGYPVEDDLHDLIELMVNWKKGQPISANEYVTTWGEKAIPDTVFHLLEQMALSTNDGKLLKLLAAKNPNNLRISDDDLAIWLEMTSGADNPRNGAKLLEYAESIRTKRVEKEFQFLRKGKKNNTLKLGTVSDIAAGKFRMIDVTPVDSYEGKEIHYKVKFKPIGHVTRKWYSSVRIGAYRQGEHFKRLGEVTLLQYHEGASVVRARGFNTNYRLDTRNHPRFPKRVEKGLRKVEATPEMTLELVLLKSECAVFMNGQAVGHWKIPPSKDPIKLSYFLSGVICEIKEVEIWELNSAVE